MLAGLSLSVLALLLSSPQTHEACATVAGPFSVTSGAPFTVTWVMDAMVPASGTDPTLVPNRIDGFSIQIDGGTRQEIGIPAPGSPCPTGTPQAGKIPYSYRTTSGVARGNHTLAILAWNYALDASGNPTATKQESAAVTLPFVAGDSIRIGPPTSPMNVSIKK